MNKLIREIQKLVFLSALLFLSACNNNSKELEKPNILWIYLEDTSPLLNCYGISNISTPNDIHSKIFSGVPTPIRYLGLSEGNIEHTNSTFS